MENSVRKYIIKLINKFSGIYRYFKRYGLKLRWNTLFHKNYSYGYLIETLQIKFILMLNDWPEYRNSDKQKEKLIELINDTEKLLLLLEKEEKISGYIDMWEKERLACQDKTSANACKKQTNACK